LQPYRMGRMILFRGNAGCRCKSKVLSQEFKVDKGLQTKDFELQTLERLHAFFI